MPSSIEKFITSSSSAEKCNSLINVIYERLITANISADPSGRMNPQDILRETIILNCKCKHVLVIMFLFCSILGGNILTS